MNRIVEVALRFADVTVIFPLRFGRMSGIAVSMKKENLVAVSFPEIACIHEGFHSVELRNPLSYASWRTRKTTMISTDL